MTRASGRMLTTMERFDNPEGACPDRRGHQADFVIAEQALMAPVAPSQGEA